MSEPLYVAFVWHMHQPYYKDKTRGEYRLPWVRLHAIRDYLHMAEVLADYPEVHATFNLTPCLVEQLVDYAEREAVDRCLAVSLKDELSAEDKGFILSFFFSLNRDKVIRRYKRYWQLWQLRQQGNGAPEALSTDDYRDLVAWFNLAWIDLNWLRKHPTLRALMEKGQGFTRQDIRDIIEVQYEIMGQILPLYQQLQASGQVELTTSPYYHPLLPLLIDSRAARVASPDLPLPSTLFAHPEDALEQVRRGVEYHQERFGVKPWGMWPPEGAVSQELVTLLAERNDLEWIASDEEVLARSLEVAIERDRYGHVTNPKVLYQPYALTDGDHRLSAIFRDRDLSDRIGFVYRHMKPDAAAEELMHRLHRIRENLKDDRNPYLVSIILNGENCWGEYDDNGDPFLRHLYPLLSNDPHLKAVTVHEYLAEHPPRERLSRLFTGSWINANLETWIGEGAQNQAWEYLARARNRLIAWQKEHPQADVETLERAWQEIYIAEGSDWFWWYYSHHNPGEENPFDREFRGRLANVYRIIGLPVPAELENPIPTFPLKKKGD